MTFRLARVSALLFFSGACALTYQVAWFRELRLIFGASTAASAAVLAVFMGGLGLGGVLLGKRADRSDNPLSLYAHLEIGVAITAALTPLLVYVAERGYIAVGGSSTLGGAGAAALRLVLSVLVLGPSTLLMGGTLPAAAKSVERESDTGRQRVAALYGVNTFGAVAGSLAANFLLLEVFGTRMTLWIAALVNVLVGVVARSLSRSATSAAAPAEPAAATEERGSSRVAWFPPAAAAIAGLTFLLMELVWYRMLGPILGGSSYTFGLILAIALVGIALGGLVYARGRVVPTFRLFALTCAIEALFIAIPYALGDRLAILALLLRPLARSGFAASVAVWAIVAAIVVLPAAIVSGFQFPVVIGLYGEGANKVGRDVGNAYFANTIGSIIGSIAGGFGLLPALGAPTCWRLVVILLAATAAIALGIDVRMRARDSRRALLPTLAGVLALACLLPRGPTAVWRHSGIGAGRADRNVSPVDASSLEAFEREARASVLWEEDGRESSVALSRTTGYSFIVNGKSDGHITTDAPTQVMGGLLGALLHPDPKDALVIGLGTGSTAGWLGKVPTIERVDVLELEPAIVRVAKDCAIVNEDVVSNPKVAIRIADAREALLTSKQDYDIVFSEPSNPYRAGIASLYTAEYYRAAAARLRPAGLFVQWIQAYEVDGWAVATVATTLHEVFPHVSTWQTMSGDLLFVAQREPLVIDVDRLRERMATEPYREAARAAWRTTAAEGVLARWVGGDALTAFILDRGLGVVNHDDQNFLEFAFARSVGRAARVDRDLVEASRRLGADVAPTKGTLDPAQMILEQWLYQALEHMPLVPAPRDVAPLAAHGAAIEQLAQGRLATGFRSWKKLGRAPQTYFEGELVAYGAARANDPAFEQLVKNVASEAERDLLGAIYLAHGGAKTYAETVSALERGFLGLRRDPWVRDDVFGEAMQLALQVAPHDANAARRLFAALGEPFAGDLARRERLVVELRLGRIVGVEACLDALEPLSPAPWSRPVLEIRMQCLREANDPRATDAEADFARFLAAQGTFAELVPPRAPGPAAPTPAAPTAPTAPTAEDDAPLAVPEPGGSDAAALDAGAR